jgi:hypothetical protein
MRLSLKMMANATFVVVFCSSYETRAEDNNEHPSSLSFVFILALQKTIMSLPTYCRLLQLKKKTKKTQKPKRG